jgi:hypothetical protein
MAKANTAYGSVSLMDRSLRGPHGAQKRKGSPRAHVVRIAPLNQTYES